MTVTENLSTVRNVINAVNIPLIVDIDTVYGSVNNVMVTVEEFERSKVAVFVGRSVRAEKMPCGACRENDFYRRNDWENEGGGISEEKS